jgi:hypothetical protein
VVGTSMPGKRCGVKAALHDRLGLASEVLRSTEVDQLEPGRGQIRLIFEWRCQNDPECITKICKLRR